LFLLKFFQYILDLVVRVFENFDWCDV